MGMYTLSRKHRRNVGLMLVHRLRLWTNINPQSAKLNNLNFHPLKVVSRWRDPQLQVGEKKSFLFNLWQNFDIYTHSIPHDSDLTCE